MQKYTYDELSDKVKEKLVLRYSDSAFDEDYYRYTLDELSESLPNDFGINLMTTRNIYFDLRDFVIENVNISFEDGFISKWRHKFTREQYLMLKLIRWERSYICKWGRHLRSTEIVSIMDDVDFTDENLNYVLDCNICGDTDCACEDRVVLDIDSLVETAEKTRDIIVDIIEDALISIIENIETDFEYYTSEEHIENYIRDQEFEFNENGDLLEEEGEE